MEPMLNLSKIKNTEMNSEFNFDLSICKTIFEQMGGSIQISN